MAVASTATLLAMASAPAFATQVDATTLPCTFGAAVKSPDGKLRLAMIVGVDAYNGANPLKGAVADAGKIYSLIVEDQKRVFPKQNVCVLTNEKATYGGFKNAFQKALVDRAAGADQVLVYYAGHGSQLADDNNDDGDSWDETLFLHDSITPKRSSDHNKHNQLRDDEFNGMLAALYEKSPNLTVILDSCHSGTATRDLEGEDIARFVEPEETMRAAPTPAAVAPASADGAASFAAFTPASFPKAVFLSASRDGEKAIERAGAGLFTRALVSVLGSPEGSKITYDALIARIAAELGAGGRQTPVLSGKGERFVFSSDVPYAPRFDWEISSADGLTIRGLPTIGMGVGAEFLIFPASLTAEQAKDPNSAKARMRAVRQLAGNEWRLELIKSFKGAAVKPGDFARLALPSASARKLKVRIRPAAEAGGVADRVALQTAIVNSLKEDKVLEVADVPLIEFVTSGFDLEISQNRQGRLQIEDPDGILRNAYGAAEQANPSTLAADLANHFQQIVLLNEWKITGGTMVANKTLMVSLRPVVDPWFNLCKKQYDRTDWPGPANTPQKVPLCASYEIVVKLDAKAPVPVVAGGSVLSADGSMFAFPSDQSRVELAPGEEHVFADKFQATPETFAKNENIFVIGLPAKATADEPAYRIPWHLLQTTIDRTRTVGFAQGERPQKEYGTYTILPIRTVANADFKPETDKALDAEVVTREYTIPDFNIAPYLPDNPKSALHKVLLQAKKLADYDASGDGVDYKQHPWCKGSEAANLANGIDCSRAIWYAFTRAKLPYNKHAKSIPNEARCVNPYDPTKDGYLYTGDMARKDYLMTDNFDDCLGERSFRLGDVLVYRDKTKGDGHVVMVIDPEQRIAWGSHGWDGNPRLIDPDTGVAPDADRGVEFQKIKFKTDWKRWDRSTMEISACWRHKDFVKEAKTADGRPGYAAICEAIDLDIDPDRFPGIEQSLCWRLLKP